MAGIRKVEECLKAVEKGVGYIVTHVGAKGVEPREASVPQALQKLPLALIMAGRKREALRLLNWMKKEMMPDGVLSFNPPPAEDAAEEEQEKPQPWPNRMAAWVAIGAHAAGRFDISMPLTRRLAECQGRIVGGIYEGPDPSVRERHHLITTAVCGLALLYCGRLEEARLAGSFLRGAPGHQPRGRTFYAWFDRAGRPVKDIPDPAAAPGEDLLMPHLYRSRKAQQYEIIGAPELFLAKLHQATGEPGFLSGARSYAHIGHHLVTDAWRSASGWISAWAESALLSITDRQRYLQFVQRLANHLVSSQDESGAWLREKDYSKISEQPPAVSLDTTASAVISLLECVSEAQ